MAVERDVPIDPTALTVPAVFINRFHVLHSNNIVRIAFSEGAAGEHFNYRVAIAMTVTDAKELAEVLQNIAGGLTSGT